jgi:hypothetical protein
MRKKMNGRKAPDWSGSCLISTDEVSLDQERKNVLMKRQFFLTICPVLTLAALMLPGSPRQQGTKTGTSAPPAATSANQQNVARMRVGENFGKLPLYFIENRGQLDRRVAFYAQGSDKAIYFTDKGLTFALSSNPENQSTSLLRPASLKPSPPSAGSRSRYTLKLDFANARTDLHPTGQAQTSAVFSYQLLQRLARAVEGWAEKLCANRLQKHLAGN